MLNAWLRKCRSILTFRGNREYKERDRKENVWIAGEQFLIVFLSTIRDKPYIERTYIFLVTFAEKFIIQIT